MFVACGLLLGIITGSRVVEGGRGGGGYSYNREQTMISVSAANNGIFGW